MHFSAFITDLQHRSQYNTYHYCCYICTVLDGQTRAKNNSGKHYCLLITYILDFVTTQSDKWIHDCNSNNIHFC